MKKRGTTVKKSAVDTQEKRDYLASLREHGRVKESVSDDAEPLSPGVTHVLTHQDDGPPLLIEKRKSFF